MLFDSLLTTEFPPVESPLDGNAIVVNGLPTAKDLPAAMSSPTDSHANGSEFLFCVLR